jgi:glycosyltransferase involved in cell wall biosynthesis
MGLRFWQKSKPFDLSVIVILYNMRREARRTLYALTNAYQRDIEGLSYEVIVVDNGSTEPLEETFVKEMGENFRYIYFDADTPSPCAALNYGAEISKGKWITLFIDGARIPSPGILHYSSLAARLYDNPFIYTLGMHIGHKAQNYLAEENYSQNDEDILLASVDWQQDGYSLFDISSVALSSREGYFSKLLESNCVTISRTTFQQVGGFDEKFRSAGGGLVNLDFFNRMNELESVHPIMLLGEATFHQFHGGTATNIPLKDHPWGKMAQEYSMIRGKPYEPYYRKPVYFGGIHSRCYHLFTHSEQSW